MCLISSKAFLFSLLINLLMYLSPRGLFFNPYLKCLATALTKCTTVHRKHIRSLDLLGSQSLNTSYRAEQPPVVVQYRHTYQTSILPNYRYHAPVVPPRCLQYQSMVQHHIVYADERTHTSGLTSLCAYFAQANEQLP